MNENSVGFYRIGTSVFQNTMLQKAQFSTKGFIDAEIDTFLLSFKFFVQESCTSGVDRRVSEACARPLVRE